jgi:hypothetical protein
MSLVRKRQSLVLTSRRGHLRGVESIQAIAAKYQIPPV